MTDSLTEKVALEAARETERIANELDITNPDHIAVWLEANTIPDEPMSQCISWLACRIVEAHERAITTLNTEPNEAAEVEFTRYFVRNYPQDTIIYNPKWHAPKIFRAAIAALRSSTSGSDQ